MINKMPGDYHMKFSDLGQLRVHVWLSRQKLLFMGGEFGQFKEWDYRQSLDWHLLDYEMHRNPKMFVRDLNRLYRNEKALYELDYEFEGSNGLIAAIPTTASCFIRKQGRENVRCSSAISPGPSSRPHRRSI